MNQPFTLSCESTVDMPYSQVSVRDIPVLFYSYTCNGVSYVDDMLRSPTALPEFYDRLASGSLPTTAQLNEFQYRNFFEPLLSRGDILHVCLGTGMTGSYQNAMLAAEELMREHPGRVIRVVDSLCSSCGYGMLVDTGADLRDQGASLDEVAAWMLENRKNIHHQFFSTDLKHYRRSGRISGPAAMLGAVLNICPIMRLSDDGRIIAYSKARGKRAAVKTTVEAMEAHARNGAAYAGKCYICHSNCPEDALALENAIRERFANVKEIPIFDIGTIIASHCGPGTVAVFFFGDERAPE